MAPIGSKPPVCDCTQPATVRCANCDLSYCSACSERRHQRGSFQRHSVLPLQKQELSPLRTQHAMNNLPATGSPEPTAAQEPEEVFCDDCGANAAIVYCQACELNLCDPCCASVHSRGAMQHHEAQQQWQSLRSTRSASNASASASVHSNGRTTTESVEDEDDNKLSEASDAAPVASQSNAKDPWSAWKERARSDPATMEGSSQWERSFPTFSMQPSSLDDELQIPSLSSSLRSLSFAPNSPEPPSDLLRPRSISDYTPPTSWREYQSQHPTKRYTLPNEPTFVSRTVSASDLWKAMKTTFASRHVLLKSSYGALDGVQLTRAYETLQHFGQVAVVREEFVGDGMLFVTFYELKAALDAVKAWSHHAPFPASLHFCLPYEVPSEHNSATVLVRLNGRPVSSTEMRQFCSRFGEVASVLQNDVHASKYVVEYNDSRDLQHALQGLGQSLHRSGGALAVSRATPPTLDMAKIQLFHDCLEQRPRRRSFSSSTSMLTSPTSTSSSPINASFLEPANGYDDAKGFSMSMHSRVQRVNEHPWMDAESMRSRPRSSSSSSGMHAPTLFSAHFDSFSNQYPMPPNNGYMYNNGPAPRLGPKYSSGRSGSDPGFPPTFYGNQAPSMAYTKTGRHDQGSGEFSLNIEKVAAGEDQRTTLMIRNIPNKYTQQMLLAEINAQHFAQYDFFYLPIDFKNKCNMGYAFINFCEPASIVPFYREFNGQKWSNFNSEKVCAISYARLQGKQAMIARFQNSSLLDKHESYRPLVFESSGPNRGKPEPFPSPKHQPQRKVYYPQYGMTNVSEDVATDGRGLPPHMYHPAPSMPPYGSHAVDAYSSYGDNNAAYGMDYYGSYRRGVYHP